MNSHQPTESIPLPVFTGALQLDAEALYAQLVAAVQGWMHSPVAGLHLVGVASGGAWLVERIQHDLHLVNTPGILSSALHRDDFAQRGLAACTPTRLLFNVNGAHLIVVDDVLYTGRTLRAVLNEIFDYGRPASVRLAVLVDRGGRELPVSADWAAARIHLPSTQSLALARDLQTGRFSFAVHPIAAAA